MSRGSGWRLGRLLVVVEVGFLAVLPGLVLVGVVGVGERRVVVLVVMLCCQVRPLLALDHVVGDVGVHAGAPGRRGCAAPLPLPAPLLAPGVRLDGGPQAVLTAQITRGDDVERHDVTTGAAKECDDSGV